MIDVVIDGNVFNSIYKPLLEDQTRTQICFGGSSSGKSYFLAQRAVIDVAKGYRNYLITRKVAATIKKSVFNEVVKAISFFKLSKYFNINKGDLVITCVNGYQILFVGLDDQEKVKSITPSKGVITDVWEEEATEDEYEDSKQLDKRLRGPSRYPKRHIMSFNPILQEHWIYEQYFKGHWSEGSQECRYDDVLILKTTYKDNRFLTEDDVKALENEKDKYWYQVYTLGNWGVLGHVIFQNWRVEDLSEIYKTRHTWNNGLDFGFAKDPACMLNMSWDRAKVTLYVFSEIYETGLTNDLLAASVRSVIGSQTVVCDSSEPKSIQELRNNRVSAIAAVKGKDSVNFGIQWLQQIQIIVDPSCVNTIRELKTYRWREDRQGNVLPEPVDKDNHAMDAMRYGTEPEQGKPVFRDEFSGASMARTSYNPFSRR